MPVNKRILVISNYPIKTPLHGGQKRVAAMVEEYKKTFSSVKFVAIFVREHYPSYDRDDIYLTGKWAQEAIHDHLTSDIKVSQAMIDSPVLRRKIKRLLLSYKPDIIEIEQVFPYIGLKTIIDELGIKPKIIYNSQNVEVTIKKDVMTIAGASKQETQKALKIIEDAELDLAQHANLLATVSKEDGEYYLGLGAPKYILAANGISRSKATEGSVNYWNDYFKRQGVNKVAAFIGSSHLPNMQGLNDMIGLRLGFLPADTRLALAGGVGVHLRDHFDNSNILDITFWQRAVSLGILSEKHLAGLIEYAEVLLLPISKGAGSNLKTAEAILSGKKVVGTTFSFRGYEEYVNLPNIWVADSPTAFREAIIDALNTPLVARTTEETAMSEQVQWHYSLKSLVEEAAKL
jgi:hypothetical protein